MYEELRPIGWVQEYFLGVYGMAFSVGYIVVYFVFSVGAVFMEKFEKQFCLFLEFFKENSKWSKKRPFFGIFEAPPVANNIVVAVDGQAERNGATFAS